MQTIFLLLFILQSTIQSDELDLSFEEEESFEEEKDSSEANDSFEDLLDNLGNESIKHSPRIYGGREARKRNISDFYKKPKSFIFQNN